MASFKVPCPSCENQVLITDPNLIGTKVECPKCKYRFKAEEPAGGVPKDEAKAYKDKTKDKTKDKKDKKDKKAAPAAPGDGKEEVEETGRDRRWRTGYRPSRGGRLRHDGRRQEADSQGGRRR